MYKHAHRYMCESFKTPIIESLFYYHFVKNKAPEVVKCLSFCQLESKRMEQKDMMASNYTLIRQQNFIDSFKIQCIFS